MSEHTQEEPYKSPSSGHSQSLNIMVTKEKAMEESFLPVTDVPQDHEGDIGYEKRRGSVLSGVLNLTTTTVGAGIMALPATMKILGLVLGLALLVGVGVLTYATIEFLIRYSRKARATSYAGVMEDAWGRPGRIVLQIFIILKTLGILIIYMIIIADVMSGTTSNGVHHSGVLEEWFGVCWWTSRIGALLFTILILVPLVSLKYVETLKISSAISVALAIVFLVITVVITVIKLIQGDIHMPRLLPKIVGYASFWKLFQAIPVMITAYICHYNVHPIQNELVDPLKMERVTMYSISLCSIIYVLISFFGYILFGEQTLSDVLANFDKDLGIPYSSVLNDIVRISYAVHLMLVFPVVHFALRINLDGLVFPSAPPLLTDRKRFIMITTGLVTIIFVGSAFIPDIWYAFQIIGSTIAVSIGFIFPGSIVLRKWNGLSSKRDIFLGLFMVIIAVISSLIALSSDVLDFIKK